MIKSKYSGVKNRILDRKIMIDIGKEVFRKSIHMCSAFVPLFLSIAYYPTLAALGCVFVFYVISETLRLKGVNIPFISVITSVAARKRDENKFVKGPVTLCLGVMICALLWQKIPYTVGIFALSFGDGLASLAGKLFGRVEIPFTRGKTAAGSLTCFTAVFVSCWCVTNDCLLSLIIASVAMFIEVLPLKDFDNLIIPIAIGGLAQLLINFGI